MKPRERFKSKFYEISICYPEIILSKSGQSKILEGTEETFEALLIYATHWFGIDEKAVFRYAVYNSFYAVTRHLIEGGFDPEFEDNIGMIYAVTDRDVKMVEYLILKGVDPNTIGFGTVGREWLKGILR